MHPVTAPPASLLQRITRISSSNGGGGGGGGGGGDGGGDGGATTTTTQMLKMMAGELVALGGHGHGSAVTGSTTTSGAAAATTTGGGGSAATRRGGGVRAHSHNYSGPIGRSTKAFLVAATITLLALITTAATSGKIEELRAGFVDSLAATDFASSQRVVLDGSAPRKDCGVTQEAWTKAAGLERRDPCRDTSVREFDASSAVAKVVKYHGGDAPWALVTGGAGFIGSTVVAQLLKLGFRVRVLDDLSTGAKARLNFAKDAQKDGTFQLIEGDVKTYEDVRRAMSDDVTFVFHLAAMSKVRPTLDVTKEDMVGFCVATNVLGTEHVLRAVRARDAALAQKAKDDGSEPRKVRVVYAGSSTYYGNQPTPFDEERTHLRTTTTPYATTKAQGEDLMRLYYTMYDVQAVVARLFMVYGPGEPTEGEHSAVTGRFFDAASRGRALEIEGDGAQFRDFIHVEDAARGLILASLAPEAPGRTVNIGTGVSVTVRELADMISDKQTFVDARENDLKGTLASTCLAKRMLGFAATHDLEPYVREQKRSM